MITKIYNNTPNNNEIKINYTNKINFGDVSVKIPYCITILIPLEQNIVYNVKITDTYDKLDNSNFYLIENNGGDAIKIDNDADFNVIDVNGELYLHLFLCFESDTEAIHDAKLIINDESTILLKSTAYSYDEILENKLTNKAIKLDKDWYIALYDSMLYNGDTNNVQNGVNFIEYDYTNEDNVLFNLKKREFLLKLFDITGFIGSYKSLLNVISFFGYKDLLSIREYWTNVLDGRRIMSDVTNEVFTDQLFRQQKMHTMKDFVKTNDVSLVYKMNEDSGEVDPDDGLPIYVNVITNTDLILTKMYAIKRILERYSFLPFNISLIDIIGEFDAIVGLNLRYIETNLQYTDVNISNIAYKNKPKISFLNNNLYVQRHIILKMDSFLVYDEIGDELDIVNGVTDLLVTKPTYFFIEQEFESLDDISNLEDFDILRKFENDTFGLVNINVNNISIDDFQTFKIKIFDVDNAVYVYESNQISVNNINDYLKIGIRKIGNFKITFVVFDYYGFFDIIDNDTIISIQNKNVDFRISTNNVSLYENEGNVYKKNMLFFSPSESTINTDYPIYDPIDTIGNTVISNYVTKDFDMKSTILKGNEIGSLTGLQLQNVKASESGYTYVVMLCDVCDYMNTVTGTNRHVSLSLRDYNWLDYEVHTFNIITGDNENFVHKIASTLNAIETGAFSNFTYTLTYFNDTSDDLLESKPYLMIKSKLEGVMYNDIDLLIQDNGSNNLFVNRKDNLFITYFDTYIIANVSDGGDIGDLTFTYFDELLQLNKTIVKENIEIYNATDLLNELNLIINTLDVNTQNNIKIRKYDEYHTDSVIITSNKDIKIVHDSVGTLYDIARSATWSNIITLKDGSDYYVGQSLYAYIDENIKNRIYDIEWTLFDNINNDVITVQKSEVLKWTFLKSSVYGIKVSYRDYYSLVESNVKIEVVKDGIVLVL